MGYGWAVRIEKSQQSILPMPRKIDADTLRPRNARRGSAPVDNEQRISREIQPIIRPGDLKSTGEIPRPGEVHPPFPQWLGRTDEHGLGVTFHAAHNVQHVMDSIDEVDVGVTPHAKHHFGSGRATLCGVAGQIVLADVSFGLNDAGTNFSRSHASN